MWTRKSTLLTGLGLALGFLGVATMSPGAVGAALMVLAFVLVNRILFRGSADVRAHRELGLHRTFEGDTTDVKLELTNPGRRLLFIEVRDRLPRQLNLVSGQSYDFVALPSGGVDKLRYEIQGPLLGVYEVGPVDLRLEDPFGLFYEEREGEKGDTFWVLPRDEQLRKNALLSNLPMPLLGGHQVNRPGEGFDFFALREYVPGDTMRNINWKASARSGKMMVNQMMRETAAEVAVFVDGRAVTNVGPEESSPRVMVARAAATFTTFCFAKKDQPRIVVYTDHVREIEPQPPERMIPFVLEMLSELQPTGAWPFKLAVSQVLPSLKRMTPVVLISPLLDDETIVEGVSTLLANDMLVAVVSPRPSKLDEATDPEFAAALMAEREATLQELRGLGADVVDLEPGASLAGTLEKARVLLA